MGSNIMELRFAQQIASGSGRRVIEKQKVVTGNINCAICGKEFIVLNRLTNKSSTETIKYIEYKNGEPIPQEKQIEVGNYIFADKECADKLIDDFIGKYQKLRMLNIDS